MKLQSMQDLFTYEVQDLYSAEQMIVDALPQMIDAAVAPELKRAFDEHLAQTRQHVERLERIFASMDQSPESRTCEGLEGILDEGKSIIRAGSLVKSAVDDRVRDAALIGAAQRVEHYEIAAYGCLKTYARWLGMDEAARLAEQTLDDENAADQKLTTIAEGFINAQAAAADRKAA